MFLKRNKIALDLPFVYKRNYKSILLTAVMNAVSVFQQSYSETHPRTGHEGPDGE